MGLFDIFKGQKKRRYNKRPKKSFEQIATEQAQKMIRENPMALAKVGIKRLNMQDAIDVTTLVQDPREAAFKKKIQDAVNKKLEEDPELLGQFVNDEINKMRGGDGADGAEGEYFEGGEGDAFTAAEQVVNQMNAIQTLKDRLGVDEGGGSIWKQILTPDNASLALGIVDRLIKGGPQNNNGGGNGGPVATVAILIDGKIQRVTEADYNRLALAGQVKPVAMLAAPAPKPTNAGPQPVTGKEAAPMPLEPAPVGDGSGHKSETPTVIPPEFEAQLENIGQYLDGSPEEFLNDLNERLTGSATDPDAQMVAILLKNTDYQGIVKMITPYRNHATAGPLVERILSDSGRWWFDELFELLKRGPIEAQNG